MASIKTWIRRKQLRFEIETQMRRLMTPEMIRRATQRAHEEMKNAENIPFSQFYTNYSNAKKHYKAEKNRFTQTVAQDLLMLITGQHYPEGERRAA
jgi:cysteine synthase